MLVTPARNEAAFLGLTIKSVVEQTARPLRWVIVSDGSTDGTDEIVSRHAAQHSWIELVRMPERQERHFAGKVDAFNAGYARVRGLEYDVIGNLDADISFEPDYLAFLMERFAANPRLGVAGTPYFEENSEHDESFKSPEHVAGACQLFRRECFEQIGGYPPVRSGGIDLIALLSAQASGWQTRCFDERVCQHHRPTGSGMDAGAWRRLFNRGRKDYQLGQHPAFEMLRLVNQARSRPYVVGAALTLVGYFWAMLRRVDRTMPEKLMKLRRKDQFKRLKGVLRLSGKRSDETATPADRS